ncbi:RNA polymerase-associated protein CTR9-like [Gracilariopsis chorda]|uniref:RNA polymerase-associated protein CTR9-like n=1 Tax=Gracilariopsis chorda TaxID=448386 RepID=A0A2V3IYM4_9FLOR|nr:RNA polymerase-associated protein CTR9-like [Gracilariopsis chorda]|eukprot:PXF47248.1 RNA polymerase-associated protein CTR9-like [Gracilariopsis chorda]
MNESVDETALHPPSKHVPSNSPATSAPIYIRCRGAEEYVAITSEALPTNPYDVIQLLKVETASRSTWHAVASAYFRSCDWSSGITVLEQAATDDVDNMLSGEDTITRLDILAALGGAYVMQAEKSFSPEQRRELLRKAGDVFARAENFDMDYPAVWTARGWAELHGGKIGTTTWFDHAMANGLVLGAIGLAALVLNKPAKDKDPVSLLTSALRSNLCPPGVWTGLAYALYRDNALKHAREVAKRAIAAVRDSPEEERLEALYVLALVEIADRAPSCPEVLAYILSEAFQIGGDGDPRFLCIAAHFHFSGGYFEKGEVFARRAVKLADGLPGHSVGHLFGGFKSAVKAEALFQHGRILHHMHRIPDAIHAFEQAKKLEGRVNPGVFLRLGMLKLSSESKEDEAVAQDCLERVLKIDDRCAIAKRSLGVMLGRRILVRLQRGKARGGEIYERAVTLLRKGIATDGGEQDVSALLVLAGLVEEYHPQEAVESYRKAIETLGKDDVDPEIWNNLSSLLARLGRFEEALEVSKNIDDSTASENRTIAYNRARLKELSGDTEGAVEIYKSISKDDPHSKEALVRLAVISISKSEGFEEAEQQLLEAMNDRYTRPTAIAHLSNLYLKQGEKDHTKYKKAQDLLEKHRSECDYLALSFAGFMHRFLNDLVPERRSRFLTNYIGAPLVSLLKRNIRNASAANGAGVYFAENKMFNEARDAFQVAASSLSPEQAARVNLAHTHVMLGNHEIRESIRQNGRPSARAVTNARTLYEQANKLYCDALENISDSNSPRELRNRCELLLYSSWALFEARQFRASADKLQQLADLQPSSAVVRFNLGYALLEAAAERATVYSTRLGELERAKTEFEQSRAALQKAVMFASPHREPLTQTRLSVSSTQTLERYVRQQAKKHDVNVRNARIRAEDREREFKEKAALVEQMKKKEEERKREEEAKQRQKQEELVKAFNESIAKQKRIMQEEEEQRRREKEEEEADQVSGEENGESKPKTKRRRRRKEKDREETKEDTKRRGSGKRKAKTLTKATRSNDSSSEYSDIDVERQGNNSAPDSDRGDGSNNDQKAEKARPTKRRKVASSDEEDDITDN